MKKQCNVCFGPIPEGRLKVLPSTTTCVTCSTESKWSGVHVIHHKTGNEVEVIKNPQTAAEFHKLSTRAGFGTTRGLKPGASKGQRNAITIAHEKFQANEKNYNSIGERAMMQMEIYNLDKAIKYVMEQYTTRAISDSQRCSIIKVLQEFARPKQDIKVNNIKKYNPYGKLEPKITKDIVSEEIEYAFRNWKK